MKEVDAKVELKIKRLESESFGIESMVGTRSRAFRCRTSGQGAKVKTGKLMGKCSAPKAQERRIKEEAKNNR